MVESSLVCVRCGAPVIANAKMYEVFEQMHWVCFHYEFEHGDQADRDKACADPSCPARSFDPNPMPTWLARGG